MSYIIEHLHFQEDKRHDFEKYSKIEEELGLDYDYASIMHYDLWAFSNNHHQTITPLKNVQVSEGQASDPNPLQHSTRHSLQTVNLLSNYHPLSGGEFPDPLSQDVEIGQRDMLSVLDTAKVNTVYKCRYLETCSFRDKFNNKFLSLTKCFSIANNCERRGACLKGRCSSLDRLGLAQCQCFEGFYGNRCQYGKSIWQLFLMYS